MAWDKLFLIGLAGAAGTLARYGLAGWVQRLAGPGFPWGTFAVNIIGSFLFGLVWMLAESRGLISPTARLVILTGFMGAFTTFSTYMFESGGLIRDGQMLYMAANIVGQVILGLAALFAGFWLGRIV